MAPIGSGRSPGRSGESDTMLAPRRQTGRYARSMRVRLVEQHDAAAIAAIYNAEVAEPSVTFDLVPRSLEDQGAWIERHRGAHPALVAVEDGHEGRLLGYASLSAFRDRPAYATSVEDSVYVDRAARSRGVGGRLLAELLDAARDNGFHAVFARIVDGNEVSIRLHAACGFELVGTEREVGRKQGRWLDVVELQCLL
jgi:L-amino acid N-acyltransferase